MSNTSKVELTYELYTSTIKLVLNTWNKSKLFSTKGDKQNLLIINSKHTYASIINTKYNLVEEQPSITLETIYGKQFAQDITSAVMQELLLGSH